MTSDTKKPSQVQITREIVDQIVSVLQGVRFGSIEIVIHDSKIVQIERKEKIRFDAK
jgi:hypothetical protein